MAITQIPEVGLKVSNAPFDGKFLQYKDSTDKLTWTSVGGTESINFNDDVSIQFGTNYDGLIRYYNSGLDSWSGGQAGAQWVFSTISPGTDTTPIRFYTKSVVGGSAVYSQYAVMSPTNKDVALFYNGNQKFITTNTGIGVTGEVSSVGATDLTLNTNAGTNSGSIVITDAADGDITLTPNGTGDVVIDGLKYPQAAGSAGQFLRTNASDTTQLEWATVSTSVTTTSGTDNFTVADGNLVIATSGHGIDFGATANSGGTMGSELLDDYEHGTFTPTLFLGSTEAGYVSADTEGHYVKIGKLVWVNAQINVNTQNSGTGALNIRGFPYDQDTTNSQRGGGYITQWWGQPSGWTNQNIHISMDTNSKAYFRFYNGSYMADINGNHLDDAYNFHYVITYFAA